MYFSHLTSRTTSQLLQVRMLGACQRPAMTAAVKMQTSAHSGVISEPLKTRAGSLIIGLGKRKCKL